MIAQIIGLLLLFFRSHGLTSAVSTEDTCCKVQVQEKTGVTTRSIQPEAKTSIAPSQSSESLLDCVLASCKTITFSRVFLYHHQQIDSCLSAFQERCSGSSKINLIFKKATFYKNQISKNWITFRPENFDIKSIRFEECPIGSIQSEAFDLQIFSKMEQFHLINTNISIFHKNLFQKLSNIKNFAVQNNLITLAESYLFFGPAEQLETLELDSSIQNLEVLSNITLQELPKVQLLSLQGNNITFIPKTLFATFPNLRSLYLDSSNIVRIDSNAFDGLISIKQVFLRNNLLSELPKDLFHPILVANKDFKVALSGNPWKCDCNLIWLKELMEEFRNLVLEEPICDRPERNKNLGFLKADFCDEAKIWCSNLEDLIEISINCEKGGKNMNGSIRNALSEGNISLAGLDCVWKSALIKKENDCAKRLWLANEDKAMVLSLYTIGTILFGVFCAVGCFLIVRKNKRMVKANQKVVVEGRDSITLPGGEACQRDNKGEIDYFTPIEANEGNEYESIQDVRKEESKSDNCPPPLPPHPFHGVKSVSLLMEGSHGKREVIDDYLL
ncbi:hypothetical protein KQX54_018270 [Cotesia glomerata]|uniref:Uncharacterized protein n=2 Tax=Cotesia glomerata TaxID=32391 RepID=A0AAV7IWR8_COTGL|nr:hypothetical protein KQX54_018270 [Cotesia glomerata]